MLDIVRNVGPPKSSKKLFSFMRKGRKRGLRTAEVSGVLAVVAGAVAACGKRMVRDLFTCQLSLDSDSSRGSSRASCGSRRVKANRSNYSYETAVSRASSTRAVCSSLRSSIRMLSPRYVAFYHASTCGVLPVVLAAAVASRAVPTKRSCVEPYFENGAPRGVLIELHLPRVQMLSSEAMHIKNCCVKVPKQFEVALPFPVERTPVCFAFDSTTHMLHVHFKAKGDLTHVSPEPSIKSDVRTSTSSLRRYHDEQMLRQAEELRLLEASVFGHEEPCDSESSMRLNKRLPRSRNMQHSANSRGSCTGL